MMGDEFETSGFLQTGSRGNPLIRLTSASTKSHLVIRRFARLQAGANQATRVGEGKQTCNLRELADAIAYCNWLSEKEGL